MRTPQHIGFAIASIHGYKAGQPKELSMPQMTDSRRKRIQAKQRKATNAIKRAAKAAKRAEKKAA